MFCLACFTWVKVWFLLQDPREVRQNKLLYIGSETSPKASHMFSLLPAIICLIALVICYLNFFHRSNWERKHVDRNQCPHQMSIIFVLATFGWKKWDFRFLSTFYRSHFYFLLPMFSLSLPFTFTFTQFVCPGKHFVNLGSPRQPLVGCACQLSADKQRMKHGNYVILKFGPNTWHLFWWRHQLTNDGCRW